MNLTSKQRAYLKGLAMTLDPIQYIGKASLTEEGLKNVEQALAARELIKVGVQKNCDADPRTLAEALAMNTGAAVVQVIGKKIVLYRPGEGEKRQIELPRRQRG